jgi:hypothetical protein
MGGGQLSVFRVTEPKKMGACRGHIPKATAETPTFRYPKNIIMLSGRACAF